MAGKFEPKVPVQLNPPKDDPISPEFLAKCNGKPHHQDLFPKPPNYISHTPHPTSPNKKPTGTDGNPCYVAIKVTSSPPIPSHPLFPKPPTSHPRLTGPSLRRNRQTRLPPRRILRRLRGPRRLARPGHDVHQSRGRAARLVRSAG
jgi:hypothetical protein